MKNVVIAAWNITEESKKLNYDAENDTNWCHLPTEMRAECIKHMGFQTRTNLSMSSKTEKSLVDWKKYHFDCVRMCYNREDLYISAIKNSDCHEDICLDDEKSHEVKMQFAQILFKTCEIDEFRFDEDDFFADFDPIVDMQKLAPFRCKGFETNSCMRNVVRFILNNCTQLDRITTDNVRLFGEMADYEPVLNVRDLRLKNCYELSNAWNLIRKWIEVDVEVDKILQFVTSRQETFDSFTTEFRDRIIDLASPFMASIRTDNPRKEIFLINWPPGEQNNDYVSLRVVMSNEPMGGVGCYDWICDRCEEEEVPDWSLSDESFGTSDSDSLSD